MINVHDTYEDNGFTTFFKKKPSLLTLTPLVLKISKNPSKKRSVLLQPHHLITMWIQKVPGVVSKTAPIWDWGLDIFSSFATLSTWLIAGLRILLSDFVGKIIGLKLLAAKSHIWRYRNVGTITVDFMDSRCLVSSMDCTFKLFRTSNPT